jgi:hypothetical protein
MHRIQIDASPHQLRKLRKGHAVRVKKGEGFELLVHPNTYNLVSRSFNKNKGAQIKLSPEELEANNVEPEEEEEEETTYMEPENWPDDGELAERLQDPENIKAYKAHMKAHKEKNKNKPINMNTMFGQGLKGKVLNRVANMGLMDELNHHLGSNYGYLARAGMDNAINGMKSAALSKHGIDARYNLAPKQMINNLMPFESFQNGQFYLIIL